MDDIPTLPNAAPIIGASNPIQDKFITLKPQNLLKHNQILSLIMHIYNWQPTGTILSFTLPIENFNNSPLFAIKNTPLWLPLNYFVKLHQTRSGDHGPGCFYTWDRLRPCFAPMQIYDVQFDDQFAISSNIRIIEQDDMCDLTLHSMHHGFYTGSIEYMFKIVSNVTTQGKIVLSRVYNVTRPNLFGHPVEQKTPLIFTGNSQTIRRKNAFFVNDLSRSVDTDVLLDFKYHLPFKSMFERLCNANQGTIEDPAGAICLPDDYVMLDVMGLLDKSAAAGSFSIEIWIRAGSDFQLEMPIPLSKFLNDANFSVASDGRPNILSSAGNNISITGPDSFVEV